ncbi:MAG: hypothetical protein ACRDJO_05745 [Actinomycetota bacterium]
MYGPRRRAAESRLDAALDALSAGGWAAGCAVARDDEVRDLLAVAAEVRSFLSQELPTEMSARLRAVVTGAARAHGERVLRVP